MKALIVAAGAPPSRDLLKKRAGEYDFIIAADGGLKLVLYCGLVPKLLVSDMDSVAPALVEKARELGSECLIVDAKKNDTDSFLAVEQAVNRGADKILLLGGTGRRIDHLLSNIMLLKWALEKNVRLSLEDDEQLMDIGRGSFEIKGNKGQTVSILPVNESATVTAEGLYYPLQKLLLKNDRPRGVSNVFVGETAVIHTAEPVLIIKIKGAGL